MKSKKKKKLLRRELAAFYMSHEIRTDKLKNS